MHVNTRYINSARGTSSNPPHEDDVFRYLNTLCLLTCLVRFTVSDSSLCCACVSSFFLHSHNKVRGAAYWNHCVCLFICPCVWAFCFCILTLSYCFWISCLLLFFFVLFSVCVICDLGCHDHYMTHFMVII